MTSLFDVNKQLYQPLAFVSSSSSFFPSSSKRTPSFLPLSTDLLILIAGGLWFVWRCCRHLDAVSYTCRRRRQREISWNPCASSQVFLCDWNTLVHTHLSAFRSPSTLLDGCSFSTLMQPFIYPTERQHRVWERKVSSLRSASPPAAADTTHWLENTHL